MKTHTIPAVAETLSVSPRTVRRLIAAGELKAVNVSLGVQARWRVTDHALRGFLRSKERQS